MTLAQIRSGLFGLGLYWFLLNLPFQFDFPPTSLGLMLFGLAWIMRKTWLSLFRQLKSNPAFIIISLLYFWITAGVLYSSDAESAQRVLVLKIPLLAWPLALAGTENRFQFNHKKLLKAFSLSAVVSALLLLCLATWRFAFQQQADAFFFKSLFVWEMVPAHYLSLYFSFAAGLCLHHGLLAWRMSKRNIAIMWWICVLLLLVVVGLSGIRIQWIAMPLVLLTVMVHHLRRKPNLLKPAAILLALGAAAIFFSPEFHRRLKVSVIEWKAMRGDAAEQYQTNPRYYLWKHGLSVIEQKPWFGHGTGGGTDALNRSLEGETATFWNGEASIPLNSRHYNLHSSYLQHLADHGIIGIILFLGLFLLPFIRPPRRGLPVESLIFLIACGISFLTESMLQRQAGLFFFAFFYALLIVDAYRPDREAQS